MERDELETLERHVLIARAEAAGVPRANILTRPELIDELLVRTAKKAADLPRARGFFGRARDLVARVIERGLHLPDAAERLKNVTATATQLAAQLVPAVVPTVTLAEIYAAQGHRARAIETLGRVLALEPGHASARALLAKLEASPGPLPREPAEDEAPTQVRRATLGAATPAPSGGAPEPQGFLDDEPLPARYDVDECVSIAVDPSTVYVYWEVREATFEHFARVHAGGTLTLRLLLISPAWDGPRTLTRDLDLDAHGGDRVVRDLPPGAVVRAAIGWRTDARFVAIAHAPALETPSGVVASLRADAFVRWTPTGLAPITARDPDYRAIGRALEQLARTGDVPHERRAAGASDLSVSLSPGSR